jgi:hypothetical protein
VTAAGALRRFALHGGLALAGGAAVGVPVRLLADGPTPAERAAAAMTVVLAAAVVGGAGAARGETSRAGRLASTARVASLAWIAASAAGAAAGGGAGALGGAVVVAACAALACGLRAVLDRRSARPAAAEFAAAGLALAPVALLFVADPWIDWRGGSPESPARAGAVLAANPLAAMTSHRGGLGVDFQRMPMLYDGPAPGVPGLSLAGQYYPSVPPSPFAWGGLVLGIGAALAVVPRRVHS